MKKFNPKRFRIFIDQWGASVTVFCGTKVTEAQKMYCKRYGDVTFAGPFVEEAQAYTLFSSDSKGVVIWFKDAKPGGGLVAHESIHAAWHILEYSQVKITYDNHEALAYLTDYIVRQIGKLVW